MLQASQNACASPNIENQALYGKVPTPHPTEKMKISDLEYNEK
jgi:hypothetical protein